MAAEWGHFIFWDSPERPQQPAAFQEIPAGSLCPFVYPPAQVSEVGDSQRNYLCVSRLNVLNARDIHYV